MFYHHKIISHFNKRFQGQSLTVLFNEILQKRFCTSFVIIKLAGRILYKSWKCLAGRIIHLRAGSMLSAGRIPFKIKKGLGAGHFHSAGRIRPAGRTLPTPILNLRSVTALKLFLTKTTSKKMFFFFKLLSCVLDNTLKGIRGVRLGNRKVFSCTRF